MTKVATDPVAVEKRLREAWAEYSQRADNDYNMGLADATEAALCALLHGDAYGSEHSHSDGRLKL